MNRFGLLVLVGLMTVIAGMSLLRQKMKKEPVPVHPEILLPNSPSLVLMFMINEKVNHLEAWEGWLRQGFKDAERSGYAPPAAVVHYNSEHLRSDVIKMFPPTLRNIAILAIPATCRWGHTTPCMHRVLETAMNNNPKSSFFAFVSGDAVPLVNYAEIVQDLVENPRSRFGVSDLNHPRSPKHHQWTVLNLKHADMLARNPKFWVAGLNVCDLHSHKFQSDGFSRVVADDEFCPLRALSILTQFPDANPRDWRREDQLPLFGYEHSPELWREINMGIIPPPAVDGPRYMWESRDFTTYVCWGGCSAVGQCVRGKLPCFFKKLYRKEFESASADRWFARKMADTCVIGDGMGKGEGPLSRYLLNRLCDNEVAEEVLALGLDIVERDQSVDGILIEVMEREAEEKRIAREEEKKKKKKKEEENEKKEDKWKRQLLES